MFLAGNVGEVLRKAELDCCTAESTFVSKSEKQRTNYPLMSHWPGHKNKDIKTQKPLNADTEKAAETICCSGSVQGSSF